ncbi:MAG: D-alanyl-D-alanine carboxypeptidase [Armatimonadetes bacterium]|nr:D-alanyl-D-alanine carboxypeptidase [Armatimonadota bacterium]
MFALFSPTSLQANLDAILNDPALKGATVCATVLDSDGKVLYEHNGGMRVMPASNQKLLTGAFALGSLGPDFQPQTLFHVNGDTLVIQSEGNPELTISDYLPVAKRLGRFKKVILEEAYRPGWPSTWQLGDIPNRYAPFISSITSDRGGLEIWWDGKAPQFRPHDFGLRAVIKPSDGPPAVVYDPRTGSLVITGTLPVAEKRLDTLAAPEPDRWVASLFGDEVSFDKVNFRDQAPQATLKGLSMHQTLKNCFETSQNHLAENLLMMASRKTDFNSAAAEMKRFLAGALGPNSDIAPYDGSGVSRHNLVTTDFLASLLRYEMAQPTSAVWLDALPTYGHGTMKTRGQGHVIHAKDGTLDHVSAYSGYLDRKDGKRYVFSLIFNEFACEDKIARQIQDQFVANLDN